MPSGLKTRHFCMLTIGSRGDVQVGPVNQRGYNTTTHADSTTHLTQPYVALSLEVCPVVQIYASVSPLIMNVISGHRSS